MAAIRRKARLSNLEKRLAVRGRLSEPDADDLSDRAIARELNVSQPFVSAVRRSMAGERVVRETEQAASDAETIGLLRAELNVYRRRETEAARPPVVVRANVSHSLPPAAWNEQREVGKALCDFDPFD